jgi:hypothetical protein
MIDFLGGDVIAVAGQGSFAAIYPYTDPIKPKFFLILSSL